MKRDGVAPKRKAKIPIPVAQMNRDLRQATGYYEIYTEILRISAPHFRNNKDLNPQFEFIPCCPDETGSTSSSAEFKFKIRRIKTSRVRGKNRTTQTASAESDAFTGNPQGLNLYQHKFQLTISTLKGRVFP